ncbi:hypothetical protein HELRODRAFT_157680 [Helobdella robusta]|uniref:Cytosolic Fe-S cluster assembly factor NUBP2 homolog n=1 Tax=Helobdella robusta TaxID=6412 RepID=T1EME5_HELRO|nr:hypothetical protein HELRODRAFT_157680 [Helobdella robusta]ESN95214.1 hypothetical protein HELRODRAFT_157680 [Helobdella robusta]
MRNIKHKLLVMSGKGGVGKSTVALQIALGLKQLNFKVGLLDIDLCGPSIPTMLQIEDKHVYQCQEGWMPVYPDEDDQRFAVMSVGFFLKSRNDPVIWRGPKKTAMIKQLLNDVRWGDLDYLIIDTPPGTSDEHLAIVQSLKDFGPCEAVLVTSPQIISVGEVRREITFCKKTQVEIIGIIENMSGYTCPHCSECTNLFSKEGGERLANYFNILFLVFYKFYKFT